MTVGDEHGKTDIVIPGHGGEPVPMRTLFYEQNSDREVHIVCTPDRMQAYAKIVPGQHFSGLGVTALTNLLRDAGVRYGVVAPGIALLAGLQGSDSPFGGYLQVARGEPMRRGENGSVEFHVQPTSPQPRYDETEAGNIDYKQLNLIENCFAGQRVASILPPGPGREGRNVMGEEISPEPGTPVRVQAGPGVVVSASGRDFTSEIEGRLVYEEEVLSVSPVLEIVHDIDLNVGNIDFVGKVVIRGSLLDGFYINARNGVEVQGDMGAARITSEGNVVVTGGIQGKGAALITCRSLTAHYIDEAVVEASGNVSVAKEILNSDVKALGRVSIPGGTVIGGTVCGFRGVEVGSAGSDMGVATCLVSGLNWMEENQKEDIRGQVAEYLDRVQSAQILLEPLLTGENISARLGSEQKSMLSELIGELRDIRDSLHELLRQRARIVGRGLDGMVDQVNVGKMLYHGVCARFSNAEGEVKENAKGPVSVVAGADEGIVVGPHRELPPLGDDKAEESRGEEGAVSA